MRILVIGSGGREHALTWKLASLEHVQQVIVAPGNGGTALFGPKVSNAPVESEDLGGLLDLARRQEIHLTVVGPEAPLTLGIVDLFTEHGLRIFGPSRRAAMLESSKAFAKEFMQRHGIPTAPYRVFCDFSEARCYLHETEKPPVIKASGLAAGKGVILPESQEEAEMVLRQIMCDRIFGDAGDIVVLEDRLIGPEVSVLAFSDGKTVCPMPPAQDHKQVFDGDCGQNTGGMGAYAPAPVAPSALITEIQRTVLEPVIDGMRSDGTPYRGVLYAGLIITEDGPKVLEFNCRLGDPEAQVILPLLQSDMVDIMLGCIEGKLDQTDILWNSDTAVCVVLASAGYPGAYEKGHRISGLDGVIEIPNLMVFHAGTRNENHHFVTNGGRVLGVTAWGQDLSTAIELAYAGVAKVHFEGMHFRRDIGVKGQEVEAHG